MAAVGLLFRRILLLMWKNLILRRRYCCLTASQIIFPILMALFVAKLNSLSRKNPIMSMDNQGSHYNHFRRNEGDMENPERKDLDDFIQNEKWPIIVFTPNRTAVRNLMSKVSKTLSLTSAQEPKPFNTTKHIETFLTKRVLENNDSAMVAVVFRGLSSNASSKSRISYQVRFVFVPDSEKRAPLPSTKSLFKEESFGSNSYWTSGFLGLQIAIDKALIERFTKSSTSPNITVQAFPYTGRGFEEKEEAEPSTTSKDGCANIHSLIAEFLCLSFIFIVPGLILNPISEKSTGIKELMKMMGLPDWMHWFGYFMDSFIVSLVTVLIIVLVLFSPRDAAPDGVFPKSDTFLWSVTLLLYFMATTSFYFFIAAIFHKSTVAITAGIIIWIVTLAFPMYTLLIGFDKISFITMMAYALMPNAAFYLHIKVTCNFEATHDGARWSNIFEPISSTNMLCLGFLIIILIVDIVLYMLLAIYFDNIFPSEFGLRKPPYYPFLPSSWSCCKGGKKQRRVGITPTIDTNVKKGFEPDPENLPIGIDIQKLSKQFGRKNAVNEVSLKIYDGQITALLGHNGAGKTTTMSMLTGLFAPTSGTAFVNGYDIRTYMDDARMHMGLCPQHNMLFDKLTVEEHLIFFGKLKGLNGSEAALEISFLLQSLQLFDKRYTLSKNISGGQKRKLCLGIALIGGSKIVILDEPTSGLDPEARRAIWDLLLRMRNQCTMLLTTHFMEEADVLGDRIAIMAEGKVRCCGTPKYLKKYFGAGWTLKMTLTNTDKATNILGIVQKHIVNASFKDALSPNSSEVSITIPNEGNVNAAFPQLFTELSNAKERMGIITIGISLTTMDDVFVKVGEEVEEEYYKLQEMKNLEMEKAMKAELEKKKTKEASKNEKNAKGKSEKTNVKEESEKEKSVKEKSKKTNVKEKPEKDKSLKGKSEKKKLEPEISKTERTSEIKTMEPPVKAEVVEGAVKQEEAVVKVEEMNEVERNPVVMENASEIPAAEIPNQPEKLYDRNRRSGLSLWFQQLYGLFCKRMFYSIRNRKLAVIQFVIPLLLHIGTIYVTELKYGYTPPPQPENLRMSLSSYKNVVTLYKAATPNLGKAYIKTVGPSARNISDPNITAQYMSAVEKISYTPAPNTPAPVKWNYNSGDDSNDYYGAPTPSSSSTLAPNASAPPPLGVVDVLKSVQQTDEKSYYEQFIVAGELNMSKVNALYSSYASHAAPLSINLMTNTILKNMTTKSTAKVPRIAVSSKMLVYNLEKILKSAKLKKDDKVLTPYLFIVMLITGMGILSASFIVAPVEERQCQGKQLQLMTGVSPIFYWASYLIWDSILVFILVVFMLLSFLVFQSNLSFLSYNGAVFFGITMLLYGLASIPFSYICSTFMESVGKGFSLIALAHFGTGVIVSPIVFGIEYKFGPGSFGWICRGIMGWFPSYWASNAIGQFMWTAMTNSFCSLSESFIILLDKALKLGTLIPAQCHELNSLNCFKPETYVRWTYEHARKIGREEKLATFSDFLSHLLYILGTGVFGLLLLILIELGLFKKLLAAMKNPQLPELLPPPTDEDVQWELKRLAGMMRERRVNEDALVVDNLSKTYGTFAAVSGLSFGVHYGECFGLLGVNGAGKTTSFRMLTGDETPTIGNAFAMNCALTESPRQFYSLIGYCPQFDGIVGVLTGAEMLNLFGHLRGVRSVNAESTKWLSRLGLLDSGKVQCRKYSGGMKRRLSAAMALIGDPPIILLDEPTSGVDPVARRQFWKVISTVKESGQAVILTSHSMDECEALCARLGIMVNGQFQCFGGVEHLKQKFAQGFSLTFTLKPVEEVVTTEIMALYEDINVMFHPCTLKDQHGNMIQYHVLNTAMSWGQIFTMTEELKGKYPNVIEDYTVKETTLEEVFLSFARLQYPERKVAGGGCCNCCSGN